MSSIMALLAVLVLPVVLTSLAAPSLGDDRQTAISNTLQTVEDQKAEIAQVRDFWTSLVANFINEGITQASKECLEKLGDKCSSELLKNIASCVNSSSINNDVTEALGSFISPLLNELKGIETGLKDPSTEQNVIDKDIWTMNLTRTDEESFAYRKNKAQSQFIVNVNPVADRIPATATSCFQSLTA